MQYLSPLPQNVQNLVVGQLELFIRCWNVKQAKRLQNFTNAFSLRTFARKLVGSLAPPNVASTGANPGAIIENNFQVSLPAPLVQIK